MKNIVLIGMPGVGKSTVGVVLAKIMQMDFCDTDLIIQKVTKKALQNIIDTEGAKKFIDIEKNVLLSINMQNSVIATGGSAVLSHDAMLNLKKSSIIVYLKADYKTICSHINNLQTRGIVCKKGQSLKEIYNLRTPLYEKYADIVIDCEKDSIGTAEKIKQNIASTI